jgi:hypothetical protein
VGLLAVAPACDRRCKGDLPSGPSTEPTGEGEPPRLVAARFTRGDTVELAFSEALSAVEDVDPEKFRLAATTRDEYRYRGKCMSYLYYCDLSLGVSSYGCSYGYGYDVEPPTRVTALELDEGDASRLRLRIDPPLDPYLCLQLDDSDDVAILMTFSSSDEPTITDLDGDELADISPRWPLSKQPTLQRDGFDDNALWLPIPCPEDF